MCALFILSDTWFIVEPKDSFLIIRLEEEWAQMIFQKVVKDVASNDIFESVQAISIALPHLRRHLRGHDALCHRLPAQIEEAGSEEHGTGELCPDEDDGRASFVGLDALRPAIGSRNR